MDPPGMSLFQGAGSIHINNSAQDRLEEQEEIEDQKRREQELHQNLRTAFDDLHDDDEASSVDTSANFTMDNEHGNGDSSVNDRPTKHPPTYLEAQHHFQDLHKLEMKSSTPLHPHHMMRVNDENQLGMTPYGAGDGQNHCVVHEHRDVHTNGINEFGLKQELANYEKLKVMYNLRVQEVEKLTAQNMELKSMSDREENSLRARLKAAVSDREKAELSLQQTQQLLATTKHAMMELTQELNAANMKLHNSDQEKEQIQLQLQATNLSLQQMQQQMYKLEVSRNHDTDTLFRETLDKHREEVERIHNDLQKEKHRLEEKELEIKTLEKRCQEKDREKEALLIEKSSTVNRLASELEAAQSRLLSGETNKLKEKLATVSAERNAAKEQVKELGSKLEVTAHELMLCRNKLTAVQKDFETWQNNLRQIVMDSLPDSFMAGDPQSPGKLSTLKDLLGRYKQVATKVATLQDELNKRDKKLEHHRKQESELKSQLDEYKGIESKLQSRIAVLQNKLEVLGTNGDAELLESYKSQNQQLRNELDSARKEMKDISLKYAEMELLHQKLTNEKMSRADLVQGANHDLMEELQRCGELLREKTVQNGELNTLYIQACSARDAITRELRELQTKLKNEQENITEQEQEYTEKIEKEKREIEKLTAELNSAKEELQRANERISVLQKDFNEKNKEVNSKLNQYLEEEKQSKRKETDKACAFCEKHLKTIRNLEEQLNKCTLRLATQQSNEELMNELRSKAEFFSTYIVDKYKRAQELRHVGTNTDSGKPVDTQVVETKQNGVASSDDDLGEKTKLMLKEREIRQQIAEKFTLEIKTIEMQCAKRIKEVENEQLNTITKLKELAEKKAHEVEMLKEFILTERAKVSEIFQAKENEYSELLKDHNSIQKDYQTLKDKTGELKIKLEKYQERVKYVEEKYRNEKDNWKRSAAEFDKERQSFSNKLAQLDAEYQLLKTKYKNAKKTAFAYKDYINKKDDHVNSELSRIKNEYMDIFVRLDSQLSHLRSVRIKQVVNNGEMQTNTDFGSGNYAEMIKRLQNDITALAESKYQGDD